MKNQSALSLLSASIIVATFGAPFAIAACANSTAPIPEDYDGGAAATGTSTSATQPTGTSAPTNTGGSNKTCISHCNTDSDCANSCPSVSAAVQCCDTSTNVCFSSPGSSCPVQTNPNDEDSGSSSSTPAY